jgi:hypothetical protein
MMTIEINEQELRNYVNELVALDSEINADENEVNVSVNEFLAQLANSPVELLGEIIADYIYTESQEEIAN